MKTIVTHTTIKSGGKEYPATVTRQIGLQEIEFGGEMITVGELVITESKLGRSRVFTRSADGFRIGPEAAKRAREIATKAMIDQGIW